MGPYHSHWPPSHTSQCCLLESWHIVSQPESLNREVGPLPDVYRALLPHLEDRGQITRYIHIPLTIPLQRTIIAVSLSDPHMYERYGDGVCVYTYISYVMAYISISAYENDHCCMWLKYSPWTASNEKEIVQNKVDTPTFHGKKEQWQLIFLNIRKFHRTLSEVVYRVR